MKSPLTACLAVLALCPHLHAAEEITAVVEAIRGKHNVPALGAATVVNGELKLIGVSGTRKFGGEEKATADDLWHLGSCTKSMTAVLAGRLVDEGRIKWATTVGELFPELRGRMKDAWKSVTLEQLLTNRSGAPGKAPGDLWSAAWKPQGSAANQRNAFATGLLQRELDAPPGTKTIYSNQGFTIAGVMLERAARVPWEKLMQEKVFAPLGIKSAGFGPPGTLGSVDQPWAHEGNAAPYRPISPGPQADNPPAIGPAGIVHMSLKDFATYAGWHAQSSKSGAPLLKPETFQKLHTAPNGSDYALGWVVTDRPWAGGTVLNHNGSNTMWFAVVWVAPKREAAFVAVTNCAGPAAERATDDAIGAMIGRISQ